MKTSLILGTAGHIDHGKTSLIRRLTGTDTDRLPEEKKRGITIELGYAHLEIDDYLIGIVDVPGHERFVRQMLAGFRLSRWFLIALASIWMTAIDLVIDPLAAGALGYWRWFEKGVYYGIPSHNFIGWFAVSFLVFWSLRGPVVKNAWAQHTGLSIILFFTVLAFMQGLVLAGLAGITLTVIHLMVIRTHFSGALFPKPVP